MNKLYHHDIQLDAEMEQLLEKLTQTTGLSTSELIKKSLLGLQHLIQENTPEKIRDKPFVGMWQDREEMQNSVAWVRKLRTQEWKRG